MNSSGGAGIKERGNLIDFFFFQPSMLRSGSRGSFSQILYVKVNGMTVTIQTQPGWMYRDLRARLANELNTQADLIEIIVLNKHVRLDDPIPMDLSQLTEIRGITRHVDSPKVVRINKVLSTRSRNYEHPSLPDITETKKENFAVYCKHPHDVSGSTQRIFLTFLRSFLFSLLQLVLSVPVGSKVRYGVIYQISSGRIYKTNKYQSNAVFVCVPVDGYSFGARGRDTFLLLDILRILMQAMKSSLRWKGVQSKLQIPVKCKT